MVKLSLNLKAELAGVNNLAPADEDGDFTYFFKVECTSCREVHNNWVGISRNEEAEISGSKGNATWVWRCKNCKRESSASFENAPVSYDKEAPKPILTFECRGCEFVEFKPDGEWVCEGEESGTKFEGVDLTEDWYDYDEKAGAEVSIIDMQWEIKRA
ncbi:DUF866-domain-containing protein [Saitoella complicata NRRL Y-17804]|nr:DUF866-domain-containing protein [Saitoella complicata NRRL Y-17804]ODQ52098.1 DUF866-domain-containing protein [Saitoella complicata NRRL Y-17804]